MRTSSAGFNVIGHVSGNLGIGVTARNVIDMLIERGHPVAVFDIDPGMGRGGHDLRFIDRTVTRFDELPFDINLFVLPPATIAAIHGANPEIFSSGRLQAGFSMWELPVVPAPWIPGLEALDVLVAESPFVQHAFQFALSGVEVLYAPHPLYLPRDIQADRTRFGLPEEGVLFLSSFEPHSDPARKNPEGVIHAFLEGAGADPDAHLVLKMNNVMVAGKPHPVFTQLEHLVRQHPRVHLFTESLSYVDTLSLYASCDVFVSLHRAEGLGLGPMECMALGKPVVATGWSGNLAYMNHTNGCLVGYRLVPVEGTIPAYSADFTGTDARWADPDLTQAADWIRRLAGDAALRRETGLRAAAALQAHHARAREAGFVDELLAIAGRRVPRLGEAVSAPRVGTEDHPRPPGREQSHVRSRTPATRATGETAADLAGPEFEIIVPLRPGGHGALADTIDSLAAQDHGRWRLTVISREAAPDAAGELDILRWEQVPEGADLAQALTRLTAAGGEGWVAVLAAGDQLVPGALAACARAAADHPEWRMLYTDELRVVDDRGREEPWFKPDANTEYLRSMAYMGRALFAQRAALEAVGGFPPDNGAAHYELALRMIEHFGAAGIGHVAAMLFRTLCPPLADDPAYGIEEAESAALRAHLQRQGLAARVGPGPVRGTRFVDYAVERWPGVSIIIPTKDQPDYIRACIESLLEKTRYPDYELLVIDNGTADAEAVAFLHEIAARSDKVRVLPYPAPYNFAAMNNLGAREATGDYLLLLNNDTVVVQEEWLSRMVALGLRDDVGVVGARLVYPDRTLQHAGVVLGMGANGVAEHPFHGLPMTAPGYMNRAQTAQEVSAVTGACMLVRKTLWQEAGGMDDDHLAVMYNDIDLCLKAGERRYKVLWTPFATVVHHGSASLGRRGPEGEARERADGEVATMIGRWLPRLARDPAYNPNLSLVATDCSVDGEMRAGWDAVGDRLRIMAMSAGSAGSREHRVCIPMDALRMRGCAATHLIPGYSNKVRVPSTSELAREAPDVLLAHNAVHDVQLEALERYRRFNKETFLVFGQDDLMTELPHYNEFSRKVYPDIRRRLRRGIEACHRLVVTTEPLADAYGDWAGDVRIVPNYLDGAVWRGLSSRRRRGKKPRVGWAGAQQHSGDLEVIFDVVTQTADEIEWVFFGLCFREWLQYGVEVHDPVDFALYPQRLAALDLDLAVAPLAHNRFNESKSNLKVLEYGALGIPVVCTDIAPYRGAPVHRVPNTGGAWLAAIRERVHDLDATARQGDVLRAWVLEHWLLEDHLEEWLSALSPTDDMTARRAAGARS